MSASAWVQVLDFTKTWSTVRVWTKKLGRVGKPEAHVYFLALTCSDAEQLGKPFLLKGNFISIFLYCEGLKINARN